MPPHASATTTLVARFDQHLRRSRLRKICIAHPKSWCQWKVTRCKTHIFAWKDLTASDCSWTPDTKNTRTCKTKSSVPVWTHHTSSHQMVATSSLHLQISHQVQKHGVPCSARFICFKTWPWMLESRMSDELQPSRCTYTAWMTLIWHKHGETIIIRYSVVA